MKRKTIFALIGCLLLSAALSGCGRTAGPKTINFWSWGNETEIELTRKLVEEFNASNADGITVKFTPVKTGDYEQKVKNALSGRTVPDVIIAGDGEIKPWIEMGGLAELDDYEKASTVINNEDMWASGVERYRYDVAQRKGGEGKLYGIMRDFSPTVIFYNKKAFEAVGVTCISLDAEAAKAEYGTAAGYFTYNGQRYFNNQVAMDWEQTLELAQLLTSNPAAPVRNDASITKYGLYVINWFCFGWSVGGDCLEWVSDDSLATGGKYEFTLGDTEPNYIVKEGETVEVAGRTYAAGEIVSYNDKLSLTQEDKARCTQLPSQRDAMQYFIDLSAKYGVSPKPDVTASSSNYGLFSSAQTAMLIDSRYAVGIFRKTVYPEDSKNGFDWDVAPLPKHKDGIAAGHSGSLAYAIPAKSAKKDAAWKFIEYMAGPEGQTAFAEAGFTIPNTRELASSDVFLQAGQKPANSKIFVDAAYYQRMGDWGYLPSKAWINEWANDLNSKVLAGTMTLDQLFAARQASTQKIIDGYYSA